MFFVSSMDWLPLWISSRLSCVHLFMSFFLGFMVGPEVLDKDGVSALAAMAEMAVDLNKSGKTLSQQLDAIYQRYSNENNFSRVLLPLSLQFSAWFSKLCS